MCKKTQHIFGTEALIFDTENRIFGTETSIFGTTNHISGIENIIFIWETTELINRVAAYNSLFLGPTNAVKIDALEIL